MNHGRFHHKVTADITFTGRDLVVLEYYAKKHYDRTCNMFFEGPETAVDSRGFTVNISKERDGRYWLNEWQWQDWKARFDHLEDKQIDYDEYRHPSENPEFGVTVEVSSRTLDLCMKILERLGIDDTWDLLERMTGKKMPEQEKQMGQLARELSQQIRAAFHAIQHEWKRLDNEARGPEPLEGELKCPQCGRTDLEWQEYVLHTRQLFGVQEGQLGVDEGSEKQVFECTKEEKLGCRNCFTEFPIPSNLAVEHTSEDEFTKKAG